MFRLMLLSLLIAGCGDDGRDGSTGPQGFQGPAGAQGNEGPQGPAGSNGTAITIVQFCPGTSSVYPSTFPEIGFCINNQVYAVYSKNDGFLTLTPPGRYTSNAVGSGCDFTLLVNCVVTP